MADSTYNNYSNIQFKVEGTIRTATALYTKIGGTLKTATEDYAKINGTIHKTSCYSNCTCDTDADDTGCGTCGCAGDGYESSCDGWTYCDVDSCTGFDKSDCNYKCGEFTNICDPHYN